MNPFNRYNPDSTGKLFIFGAGDAISAAAYVASNIFSWSEARQMPQRQADANKEVLEKQKEQYDEISEKQRSILQAALNTFISDTNAILGGQAFEDAFPEIPVAAEYVPVDACCVQSETIECNIERTERANAYVSYVNRLHEQNDLMHCLAMDPRFMVTLDIQSKSVQDLARGILPVGDVVEVLNDTAEQACLMGRIGNTKRTTARDLGISKLRAQAAGRDEFRKVTQWANTVVSPFQRQHDIMEMAMTPQQRVELALQQAQLIQQSLQNKNNALAQKKPYKMAELQTRLQMIITRLQQKSTEALLVNTHVPNFGLTVAPRLDNFSQLVGGIGQSIQAAQRNHFYGAISTAQDGSPGTNSPNNIQTARNASDRPAGY